MCNSTPYCLCVKAAVYSQVRMAVHSRNVSSLGVVCALGGGAVLTVAVFRLVLSLSHSFALSWWLGAVTFVGSIIVGQLVIHVRDYAFDGRTKALVVQGRWLGFIPGRRRVIPFAEISGVHLRSRETVDAVVALSSGRKVYPRWSGTVRQIHRFCAVIKRITRVGTISQAERRARGRRNRGFRRVK